MAHLFFNANRLKCIRANDAFGDPDFYLTWQVWVDKPSYMVPLHQGFSMGAPIDDGHSVRQGCTIPLTDSRFTVKLPTVREGDELRIVTDLYCWESDHSSERVKSIFTNAAAAKLFEIYNDNGQRRQKTMSDFTDWLRDDAGAALTQSFAEVSPFVSVANSILGLLDYTIRAIRSNSDDYIGVSRTELFLSRQRGKLQYRYLTDGGIDIPLDRESAPYFVMPYFREASGDNIVQVNALFQVLFDLAELKAA